MIRINLLPPEFRKRRRSGVDPAVLALIGGCTVLLIVVLFGAWVQMRLDVARELVAEREVTLKEKIAQANLVRELDKQIAEAKRRESLLQNQMAQKVPWTRTLDDFADQFGRDRYTLGGFQVAFRALRISQAAAAATRGRGAAQTPGVLFNVQVDYELVGAREELAGEYIKSFFDSVKSSAFWTRHGFAGDPIDTYTGDVPAWNADIERVVVLGKLSFVRVHLPVKAPPARGGR